jgi:hypothetical protein
MRDAVVWRDEVGGPKMEGEILKNATKIVNFGRNLKKKMQKKWKSHQNVDFPHSRASFSQRPSSLSGKNNASATHKNVENSHARNDFSTVIFQAIVSMCHLLN